MTLSRICLLTCVSAVAVFSLVGAAEEKKVPDDLSAMKVRLRINAIETAKITERFESLIEREMKLQDSVRACIKSGDNRGPQYQQTLQEVQADIELAKEKLIALESEKAKLRKRLGEKKDSALDQMEEKKRILDKILERLDNFERRLQKIEKHLP